MDKLTRLPTDIILIVNLAWNESFTKIKLNKKSIADCSWNSSYYNLILDKSIGATISKSEFRSFLFILKANRIDEGRSGSIDHVTNINPTESKIVISQLIQFE